MCVIIIRQNEVVQTAQCLGWSDFMGSEFTPYYYAALRA